MRAATVGGLVGGILVATSAGAVTALVVAVGLVAPECPGYDDEGTTAAAGSPYAAVMCGGLGELPGAVLVPALTALVVATVLAVVLGRRRTADGGTDAAVAVAVPVIAAAVVPLLTLLVLHHVLPRDCLGGDDGSPACETDRELL